MSERELFIAALQHEDPAERAAFLAKACGADAGQRARIEHLRARLHAEAGEFLEQPASDPHGAARTRRRCRPTTTVLPPTSGPDGGRPRTGSTPRSRRPPARTRRPY